MFSLELSISFRTGVTNKSTKLSTAQKEYKINYKIGLVF